MAPSTTLSGIAAVKLKPLKNLRPSGPSTLKPQRGLSFLTILPISPQKKKPPEQLLFLYVISGQPDKP